MDSNNKLEKLLEPSYIGSVKTRNRIIKTGAAMGYWHEDDLHMSEKAKAYYEAIAKGGVGLLIVEAPTIDYPYGARWKERYRMDDDKYIQGMSELVDVIHKHGCPTFMQMEHDGPWQSPLFALPPTFEGPPIAASPVNLEITGDFHRDVPRELTIAEIEELVDKWASAAVRARKAGFDGVDINAGSTHQMHNFLSPFWNRRQDIYGGTLENRTRFFVQVVKEIKKRAGQDFPIDVILNGIEIGETAGIDNSKCLTHEESKKIALILQEAGVNSFQIRNQWLGYHTQGFFTEHLFWPEPPIPETSFPKEYNWKQRGVAANIYMAESFKRILSVPIIAVGRLDWEIGEEILQEGKADFIAMTRRLQADPELPNKLITGRLEDIAPCTACGTCLSLQNNRIRRCRINAAMGTTEYTIEKAEKKKKIVVVGGGPGGMEAARVAAIRGHDVTLYEKANHLGGLLYLASLIKGAEPEHIPDIIRYFKTQLEKLGVKTVLGKEADISTIEKIKPDVVILATGGTLTVPKISGIDKPNVVTTPALHRKVKPFLKFFGPKALGQLTKMWLPMGKSVIVIGSDLHGFEVVEFLVKRGRKVTMVDTSEIVGEGMLHFRLAAALKWFKKKGVTVISGVKSMEINDKGMVITTREGKKETLEADSILPTSPLTANTKLLDGLKGKVSEIYTVGDCSDPRMIVDAVGDGWRIARNI
jgi:2,4-dienoyl-CoA reductase (NADPH2)